jgi:hypothetical protein
LNLLVSNLRNITRIAVVFYTKISFSASHLLALGLIRSPLVFC